MHNCGGVNLGRMRFQGNTIDLMPDPPRCAFPSCTDWGEHEHHITYDPPVSKRLCVRHHEEITIINGQQARKYRRSLSNNHRWWIWYQWIAGKLKARRTQKALEYTGEWDVVAAQRQEAETERENREAKRKARITITFATASGSRGPVSKKGRTVGRTNPLRKNKTKLKRRKRIKRGRV